MKYTIKKQQIGFISLGAGANFSADIAEARRNNIQTIPRHGGIELWTQETKRTK